MGKVGSTMRFCGVPPGWQGWVEEGRKKKGRREGICKQSVAGLGVETLSLHFISGASEVMSR